MSTPHQRFLAGDQLYGDDLDEPEIKRWLDDEAEAYAELVRGGDPEGTGGYGYHALNQAHGFRYLPDRMFSHVLGVGSGTGAEFEPLAGRFERLTIVEPSERLGGGSVAGVDPTWVRPSLTGDIPLPDDDVDLAVAFGALHHIPTVTAVVRELARVIRPDGWALVREPTISLGDWREERPGRTPHERGLPLQLFTDLVSDAGFDVMRSTRCIHAASSRLSRSLSYPVFDRALGVRLDRLLCWAFGWNTTYHATSKLQQLRPTSVFLVLRRR